LDAIDPQELEALYVAATDGGDMNAPGNLAVLLFNGDLLAQDDARARTLAELGAERGNDRAMRLLAYMVETGAGGPADIARAQTLYAAAAEAGNAGAANDLGLLLEYGAEGLAPDLPTALDWYDRAQSMGSVNGMLNLAWHLSDGIPEPVEDPARAVALYRAAHEAGDSNGTRHWAIMLRDGHGTQADPAQAAALLRQAAEAGSGDAALELGVMLSEGAGIPADPEGALAAYRMAVEAGQYLGGYNSAMILFDPDKGPHNPIAAHAWCLWSMERLNAPETIARLGLDDGWLSDVTTTCTGFAASMTPEDKTEGRAMADALLAQF
jgi:hypothetical protein